MKKILFILALFTTVSCGSIFAQKYALVDMEYILGKIPKYETANSQLENISKQWQTEVDAAAKEVDKMYKKYQADLVFLAGEAKTTRENEIVKKENEINTLRNKYFGPQGELIKRREALIKPIQDDVYKAVKELATANGYQMVIDRASASSIIFASPSIDISEYVLKQLGYK